MSIARTRRKARKEFALLGPCTVIGPEGSNYWLARGGRCLLAAPQHLREAVHEEVSETLRIKAALYEAQKMLDHEFEEFVDTREDETKPYEVEMEPDVVEYSQVPEGMASSSSRSDPSALKRKEAKEAEGRMQKAARQHQLLDDVPVQVKKKPREGNVTSHQEAMYVKKFSPQDPKALEKEIPWNYIPEDEKELFRAAEEKQWREHLEFGAVRPMSLEESREVEAKVGKERILPARFLYRDKNLAKRRGDPQVACKAKARLCVGGQKDPDLGNVQMAVDAPTANRQSLLLGLTIALSRGWSVAIGDIRSAFLNGVEAPRRLYFRQPVRGIPGLQAGQLVEIIKGGFGLATSPKLWWLKLSGDLLKLEVEENKTKYFVEQNEIDPCAFRICCNRNEEKHVEGMVFTHVDDLMVMASPALMQPLQDAIKEKFPVDEWESDEFEYVGCEYKVTHEKITIKQTGYVNTRLEKVTIPPHVSAQDAVDAEVKEKNRSTIGCLSWLAKQTRPDLQFMVAQAQRSQNAPTVEDVKWTNAIVEQARKFQHEGLTINKIAEKDLAVCSYHDAAWANVSLEAGLDEPEWDGDFKKGSQLAHIAMVIDQKCLGVQEAGSSVIDWRSKGSGRVCRSTFAGETLACSDGVESAIYVRALLLCLFSVGSFSATMKLERTFPCICAPTASRCSTTCIEKEFPRSLPRRGWHLICQR